MSQYLVGIYKTQRDRGISGNIYWKTQIDMAYNSNHIEGSRLTHEQTRLLFDTGQILGTAYQDDVFETANHFRMFDYALDNIVAESTVDFIKTLHSILKAGTKPLDGGYGEWKLLANQVGDTKTASPSEVDYEVKRLVQTYQDYKGSGKSITLEQIAAFHVAFETIHPFLDGNGRVGRILMFAQCLANDVQPFIVLDESKAEYYHGLSVWDTDADPLLDYFSGQQAALQAEYQYLLEGWDKMVIEE